MEVAGPIVAFLILGGLVAAAVYAFSRARAGQQLTFGTFVAGYAVLMIAVSAIVLAGGVAALLKAGFSEVGGRDFSYTTSELRYIPIATDVRGEPVPAAVPTEENYYDPSEDDLREDLALGITLSIVGGVMLGLHLLVRRAVGTRVPETDRRNLDRALVLILALIAGIGTLIAAGLGLADWLRRTVLETDLEPFESPPHPGDELAWASVFLALWIVFGSLVWRQFRERAVD